MKERRSILWAIEWRAEVGQRIQNPVLVPPWLLNGLLKKLAFMLRRRGFNCRLGTLSGGSLDHTKPQIIHVLFIDILNIIGADQ